MNEINQQVRRARRRVVTGRFFNMLTLAAFSGLLVAVIGMAIPKIWHLSFLQTQNHHDAWVYSWIIGGAVIGFLAAAILTWKSQSSQMDVAVEVDKRFGLKERLSSAMSLTPEEAETKAGQALMADAESRAETIDVRDEFRYKPTWRALLPLVPIMLLIGLMFVPNAEKKVVASEGTNIAKKKREVIVTEFKKKIEEKRERRLSKGLKDADKEVKSLEEKFDQLLDDGALADKKQSLVKLNDIKKQIEDKQREIGSSKELRQNLNKLKDTSNGPAKELADAMSEGDMEAAKKAIQKLADKLKSGKLNKIEMKKLAKDMENMADELRKIAEKHQADKQKLEDEIKKAVESGDLDKAAKLQEKLNQKKAMDKQQDKMQKMADKLKKCANCMKPGGKPGGNGQKQKGKQGGQQPGDSGQQQAQAEAAGESLEDLAKSIEGMQQQLEDMEALEDLREMAEGCKNAMQGGGEGDKGGRNDWAKGKGPGGGKRGLEKEKIGRFKTRDKGSLQKGETVVTGDADGENITGRSVSETRELVKASMSEESDPLQDMKLPKSRREHGQQYFKNLRGAQ